MKETSKEILEEDKNKITNIKDKASSWYNENKQELVENANEIYYNDKETITNIYNKFKKSE